MNKQEALDKLPESNGAIVILSGGMDSTIAMRLAVEKYNSKNVKSLSFNYGQGQLAELNHAAESSRILGVDHRVFDLKILKKIGQGFSANLDKNIPMPTITEVIGDPRPKTYVPNRNMILMSIAAAAAEVEGFQSILIGLQQNDSYNYHDTTLSFLEKINQVLNENRIIKIQIYAPFMNLTKTDEIKILQELDGNVDLLKITLTCYNPRAYAFYDYTLLVIMMKDIWLVENAHLVLNV